MRSGINGNGNFASLRADRMLSERINVHHKPLMMHADFEVL
jgi:hypothetical protein